MAAREFKFEMNESDGSVFIEFFGYLDEHAEMPKSINSPNKLIIDLEGAIGINSIGIRSWCEWIEQFKATKEIMVYNCPVLFVKAFNTVLGAKTDNMHIESFYVPFVSEDGSDSKFILLKSPIEFEGEEPKMPEVLGSDNKPMEVDVLSNYFDFLKK